MLKIIVTHANPDPDAICSVWLLRRFDPDWEEATVEFVSAGSTYQGQKVDSDPSVLHVDTGFGRFDHHDTKKHTSAAKLVLDFLQDRYESLRDEEALVRLVDIIVGDDHFEDCYWPQADHDRYMFFFTAILDGLKKAGQLDDDGLVNFGMSCLDGVLSSLRLKVEAEREIREIGQVVTTKWGKALAIESRNDDVMKLAQRQGYIMVVRKDPEGMVRIKAQPDSAVDLSKVYLAVKKRDPKATWFLHVSKKMLLNGSYKNPDMVPSKLSLAEVVSILRSERERLKAD